MLDELSKIRQKLEKVHERIRIAEKKYDRESGSVQLIAVSKTKPVELILSAIDAGQRQFGENYVQEAVSKIEEINNNDLQWHFLGPIQSNKTRLIATNFSWVHSVDRLKIAQRLSEQRPENLLKLNICLQVNISDEETKSGVKVNELNKLVESVLALPNIHLRGFMAIPQKSSSLDEQRKPFRDMRITKEKIEQQFDLTLDTLSMGMSADLEAAIAEGASHVRIGTDIFGAREPLIKSN